MKVLFVPDYSAANAYQRSLAAALEAEGVEVAADPTRSRRLLPVTEAVRTHGRPDVIHLHWTEPYIASGARVSSIKAQRTLMELRLARRRGSAVVWTAHDLFRHDADVDPRERRFMRSLYRLADATVVHCKAAREGLCEALGISDEDGMKIEVVPHGHYAGAYPDHLSRAEARERLGLEAASLVVAFVGWVRPYKGVAELIAAFGGIDDPDARLVIAGKAIDGDYAGSLDRAAAGDPRVMLRLGFVPDDELQIYLRAADVVATPFLEIFTSGSVLLAMSFDRAIIAPKRGCVVDVLDDAGGLLYDADDPQGLQEALRIAGTADLDGMGRHNRDRLDDFSWERVASATNAIYERVTA